MSDVVQIEKDDLIHHLKTLAQTKRAILQIGDQLLETDPGKAATILNAVRALTTSSRMLAQRIKIQP